MQGPDLARDSFTAATDTFPLEIPRGHILDRNRAFLSPPVYHRLVAAYRPHVPPFTAMGGDFRELSSLLKLTPTDLYRRLFTGDGFALLAEGISGSEARRIRAMDVPGIIVAEGRGRGGSGSAALAVVGTVDEADNRGESGLELVFDRILRGGEPRAIAVHQPGLGGSAAVPAGSRGWVPAGGPAAVPAGGPSGAPSGSSAGVSPWHEVHVVDPGGDIVTTLNGGWQHRVEGMLSSALAGHGESGGAAVIVDSLTGDVLVMASHSPSKPPGPGPEDGNISYEPAGSAPPTNLALRAYPAGGMFRLVVAAAALETGAAQPGQRLPCVGYVDVGSRRLPSPCGREGTQGAGGGADDGGVRDYHDGTISLEEAMSAGSGEVFSRLALAMGNGPMLDAAVRFGLGSPSGLPLPGEDKGVLPRQVHLKNAEDTVVLATGLGSSTAEAEASPVQLARMMAAVVNRGQMAPLRLVAEIRTAGGALTDVYPLGPQEAIISPATARWLRAAMARGGGLLADHDRGWAVGFGPNMMPRYAVAIKVDPSAPGVTAEVLLRRIVSGLLSETP